MTERLTEFVRLADHILANPVARDGLRTTLTWTAGEAGAPGTISLQGPNEYLFRALLLDVRNVMSGDLALREVIADLRREVTDPEVRPPLDEALAELDRLSEQGMIVENERPVSPASIFRLWAYAEYHHRDLAKLRRLRALDPLHRMVYRFDFVQYVAGLCAVVAQLRGLIWVARQRGYLEDLGEVALEPLTPVSSITADAEAVPASPATVMRRGLFLLLQRQGGRLDFTADDVEQAIAPYGGPARALLKVKVDGTDGAFSSGSMWLEAAEPADVDEPDAAGHDDAPASGG